MYKFQRELRLRCAIPSAKAAIKLADEWVTSGEPPKILKDLCFLGSLASSVVNFNVESMTSRLLTLSSAMKVKAFHPPVAGSSGIRGFVRRMANHSSGEPCLNVFHPHGAVDVSGRAVMTSRDYQSLAGTLGLEIATHQAFMENLLIIGMSLDDQYLREQLVRFRPQIKHVFWVRSESPCNAHTEWALANDITVVSIADYSQHWSLFTDLDQPGISYPGALLCISLPHTERLARAAKGLSSDLPRIFELAHDIPTMKAHIASDADFATVAHHQVFAAERGEDPNGPDKLPQHASEHLAALRAGLDRIAKNLRPG